MIEWLLPIAGIGLLALFVLALLYYYNKIYIMSNRIDNAMSQIDVQLKKRADLIPNLVKMVKGYMKHERTIFGMVTEAHKEMMAAKSIKDKAKADDKLSAALKTIFALAENYPNLKASENFKILQEELAGVEGKIAYARQFYNDSVLEFNNIITTIPGKWFASVMGKRKIKEYFKAEEKERKNVEIKF